MRFRTIPVAILLVVLVLTLHSGNAFPGAPMESVRPQADVVRIRELFESRKFPEVTDLLEKYQASREKDIRWETALNQAFSVFDVPAPFYKALLDDWVSVSSKSWVPFLARANYYNLLGWKARGTAWAKETSEDQFRRMEKYLILAAKDAQAALKINPRLSDAYIVLMDINRSRGDQEVGSLLLQKALKECPDSFIVRWQHMMLLTPRWGGSHEAMRQFGLESAASGKNPDNKLLQGLVYWDMGRVALREDKIGEAIDLYKKALTFGESYTVLNHLAEAYVDARKPEMALEAIDRAIAFRPNAPYGYGVRSKIFLSREKWDDALRDLEEMKRLGGKYSDGYIETRAWEGKRIVDQAHALVGMRLLTQAIEKYDLALRFDPENAQAYCWRGRVFDWTGNDRAEEDLRKAVSLDPRYIETYVGLDQLLFKKRRLDEIVELWNRYMELEPGIARAYLERSGTHYHRKDMISAYRDVKRACELGSDEGCTRLRVLQAGPQKDKFAEIDRESAAGGSGSSVPKDPGVPVKTRTAEGKWSYRNAKGVSITAEVFEDAWDFKDGYARVKQNGKWGFLDGKGTLAIKPQYDYCWDFSGDKAKVRLEDGSTHYIDRNGKRETE